MKIKKYIKQIIENLKHKETDPMISLKEKINHDFHSKYKTEFITIGDFSYGVPEVRSWGENTTLTIGKFCSFADGVTIFLGGNHRTDWGTTFPFNVFLPEFSNITGHPATKGNVIIGNDVWVGSDVKIMSGVKIGDGSIIAANAVVTKDVEPYSIVGGVPASFIRKRFSEKIETLMLEMKWWNWEYENIYKAIPMIQSGNFTDLYNFYIKHVQSSREEIHS